MAGACCVHAVLLPPSLAPSVPMIDKGLFCVAALACVLFFTAYDTREIVKVVRLASTQGFFYCCTAVLVLVLVLMCFR